MADEQEINKARRIRGVFRGGVTRIMNQIYEIIGNDEIDNDGPNKLVALKNNIVDKLERVKETDMKLEHLLIEGGDNFEPELNEAMLYHEPFYELFVAIEQKLTIKDGTISHSPVSRAGSTNYSTDENRASSVSRSNYSNYPNINHNNNNRNVHLPCVDIEPFDVGNRSSISEFYQFI